MEILKHFVVSWGQIFFFSMFQSPKPEKRPSEVEGLSARSPHEGRAGVLENEECIRP